MESLGFAEIQVSKLLNTTLGASDVLLQNASWTITRKFDNMLRRHGKSCKEHPERKQRTVWFKTNEMGL